jgi:hypothetical protein
VSLPSEDKRNPNVFEFGTSYKDILAKLEERGLDKYLIAYSIVILKVILIIGMSTLGARTSEKCWSATLSSSVLLSVGKTALNSENSSSFYSIVNCLFNTPSFSKKLLPSGMMWSSPLMMKFMTWFS